MCRKENGFCKVIPLAAVGLSDLIIMLAVFFQHIHSFIVHVKPAVTCVCLAAFLNACAGAVFDEMPANMYSILVKIHVIPRERT